jgi:hypothetical protein
MLTHAHKVIHKVVSTFGRVFREREKWRFGEETEAKQATGSDRTLASGAPAHPVKFRQRCALAERADAGRGTPVHPGHGCVAADAGDLTYCVSVRSR